MIFENKVLGIYKKKLIRRLDGDGSVFYFGKEDFPGLCADDVSFLGDKGQRLYGHFYFRGDKRYDRLMILDHGMGCGHVSYMREIDEITRRGYTVFTYDHTGTRESEGESIGGLTQSLVDLDYALCFIKSLDEYKGADLSVIGHSWGGFSCANISALHPEISHAVVLSPFISVRSVHNQIAKGPLYFYRNALYKFEQESFPRHVEYDARKSLKSANTRALFIHSRDDKTCDFRRQFETVREALGSDPRFEFLTLDGKDHHPHYTANAVKMRKEYNRILKEKRKKKELTKRCELEAFAASYDWWRMTEQDTEVWDRIFEFLEK